MQYQDPDSDYLQRAERVSRFQQLVAETRDTCGADDPKDARRLNLSNVQMADVGAEGTLLLRHATQAGAPEWLCDVLSLRNDRLRAALWMSWLRSSKQLPTS